MRTKMFLNGAALLAALIFNAGASLPAQAAELTAATDYSTTAYVLREEVGISPIGPTAQSFVLEPGTELAILGTAAGLVHVGMDVPVNSGRPSDFWVRAEQLPASALEPFNRPDVSDIEGDWSAEDVGILMTYCYRFVKQYLLQTHQVPIYLPGESAWMAAGILPHYGFHRTGRSPTASSNGDVCVYSGGPQGHGHIEIKRGGGWWYGYGVKPSPIHGRHFIACFRK